MDEESEGASSSLTVYSRENGDMSNKKEVRAYCSSTRLKLMV